MKGVFAVLAVVSLCACGGSGGGGGTTAPPNGGVNTPPPVVNGISVNNDAFSPGTKTITSGTTLKWAWNSCSGGDPYGGGQTCVSHSVTFDDGSTSSPLQNQGTFEKTFSTPGTFTYHCSIHGSMGMTGTITVQ